MFFFLLHSFFVENGSSSCPKNFPQYVLFCFIRFSLRTVLLHVQTKQITHQRSGFFFFFFCRRRGGSKGALSDNQCRHFLLLSHSSSRFSNYFFSQVHLPSTHEMAHLAASFRLNVAILEFAHLKRPSNVMAAALSRRRSKL